jgi:ribosomal protein S12 methylthiotransferase
VLIEGNGDGISLGRSYRDAPEIDGMVIVEGEIPVGRMLPVRINGAMAYDLSGVVDTGRTIISNEQIRTPIGIK